MRTWAGLAYPAENVILISEVHSALLATIDGLSIEVIIECKPHGEQEREWGAGSARTGEEE